MADEKVPLCKTILQKPSTLSAPFTDHPFVKEGGGEGISCPRFLAHFLAGKLLSRSMSEQLKIDEFCKMRRKWLCNGDSQLSSGCPP